MTIQSVSRKTPHSCFLAGRTQVWPWQLVVVVICLSVPPYAQESAAQPPNQKVPNVLPAIPLRAAQPARHTRLPQLSDLAQVKLDTHSGKPHLIMMLDSFRMEKRTGRVIKHVPEMRTRMVADGQGGQVEQIYTIHVAVVEEGEIEYKIAAGRKPLSQPASQFRFFELTGNELSLEAASEKLRTLQPVFLLDRFVGELPEIPEIYRQAMHPSCLVIVSEEALRDFPQQTLQGEILPAKVLPAIAPRIK